MRRAHITAATVIAGMLMAVPTIASNASAQTIYRDSSGAIVGTSRSITMPGANPQRQYNDTSGIPVGSITGDGFGGAFGRNPESQLQGTIRGDSVVMVECFRPDEIVSATRDRFADAALMAVKLPSGNIIHFNPNKLQVPT